MVGKVGPIRQVCATLLGARHVLERLCGGSVYLRRYNKCSPLPFLLFWCSILLGKCVCRLQIICVYLSSAWGFYLRPHMSSLWTPLSPPYLHRPTLATPLSFMLPHTTS